MRRLLALAGWPAATVPPGGWSGADAAGRPLVLGYLHAGPPADVPAVATNETRSVQAVLVGTVDNRRELRSSLEPRHAFRGRDDAEVLIHLYEERDVPCVKALRGGFALALWDAPRRRFLLARDPLGLVPLYYAAERGRLAAATALPALTGLPGLATSWDLAALDAYLTLGSVPAPGTLYPAIRQVRPGELLVWEDGQLRTQRYWQLTFSERRTPRAAPPEFVREQLREVLGRRQAGVVVGLLLSGGLGAAALLALAVEAERRPARAYTAALPGAADDEVEVAARLATGAGVEHVVVREEPDWPAAIDALLAAEAGPAGGPEAPVLQLVTRRAAGDVTVALAGLGSEELFGGSAPVRAAERVRRYRRLPGLVREGAEMWARLAPRVLARRLAQLLGEERLAPVELYARAVSLFVAEERAELYTPEALAAIGDSHPWRELTTLFAEAVAAGAENTADAMHYLELALHLPARAAALAAMASPLEVRFPLADHRLAQLVASVPPGARGGVRDRARLLQRALAGLLPAAVLGRPHASAGPRPEAWARGALREALEETLAPARVAAQGIFRHETVERLRREHLAGRRDHGPRLWAILLATRWIERQAVPAVRVFDAAG